VSAAASVEILRALVAIPTPSAVSNLPLLHWVRDFLEPRGWRVTLYPYTDEGGVAKANLIARPGAAVEGSSIALAFVCHTDTVPYAANWDAALSLEERNGRLHGCGACDVKGALACFLAAAAQAGELQANLALLLTADEEIGCKGMDRLLAETRLSIGSAIVSEPTSLRPGVAGKGYGLARVTVTGAEAHSAYPQMGASAISAAARLITALEDAFAADSDDFPADALFQPARTTLNIGVIEGGSAKNIIAGSCSFLVEWRPVPAHSQAAIARQLQQVVDEAQLANSRVRFELEIQRAEPGFAPAAEGGLQKRLAHLLAGAPTGISFGSEASRLARVAREVIVIGPGEMTTAHSSRECVPAVELEAWTATLVELLHA
jgi:acetylornithine deacetylase